VCCRREVTEIYVVTLLEFGPAEAHAFGHKRGIREIRNGSKLFFFFHGATAPGEPGTPCCQGLKISLRNTTLGRISLDE
jgi:hypothetical protein